MENYSIIIEKAKELSELIENHDITVRYMESVEKMKGDMVAQKILADLVLLGRDLNEAMTSGDGSSKPGAAEIEILKQEFEKNETVKNHILVQKEYLDLIKAVQDRIKNPAV